MKKVLYFLFGLVCDTYACVQFNELTSGGGLKNAILLCVMLAATYGLFSSITTKNTVPRYLLQGAHALFCLLVLFALYGEISSSFSPPSMEIASILYFRSLISLSSRISIPGIILCLVVVFLCVLVLDDIRVGYGEILPSTIALWLLTDLASCFYQLSQTDIRYGSIYDTICVLIPLLLLRKVASGGFRSSNLRSGVAQSIVALLHLCFVFVFIPNARDALDYVKEYGLNEETFLPMLLMLILLVAALWMAISGLRSAFRLFKAEVQRLRKKAKPKKPPMQKASKRKRNRPVGRTPAPKTAVDPDVTVGDPGATVGDFHQTVPEYDGGADIFSERIEDEK